MRSLFSPIVVKYTKARQARRTSESSIGMDVKRDSKESLPLAYYDEDDDDDNSWFLPINYEVKLNFAGAQNLDMPLTVN